jgi:hypothetical protein
MPDITFTTVGGRQKRLVDIGDDTFAEVTSLPILLPAAWTPASAFNGRVYPDVEIQVIGTPTTSYIFQDSFDGVAYNDCNAWDRNGQALAAIAAAGRYRLPGNCFLRARQGAGASIIIRAGN